MADEKSPKRTRRKPLSEEDERLWGLVAASLKPLGARARRAAREQAEAVGEPDQAAERRPARPAPEPKAAPSKPGLPPLARFDTREARQLGGGRVDIDARVDLHGLRQREAYHRLKVFLAAAQAKGHRRVLVITGKGGRAEDDDGRAFWETSDRGVLKRLVPQWLGQPGFRHWVVGFTTAQARHGGEGALYVRLRKQR